MRMFMALELSISNIQLTKAQRDSRNISARGSRRYVPQATACVSSSIHYSYLHLDKQHGLQSIPSNQTRAHQGRPVSSDLCTEQRGRFWITSECGVAAKTTHAVTYLRVLKF